MKVEKGLSILPHCKQSVAIFGDLKKKRNFAFRPIFIFIFFPFQKQGICDRVRPPGIRNCTEPLSGYQSGYQVDNHGYKIRAFGMGTDRLPTCVRVHSGP
jgi:hypothetical protein